MVTFNLSYTAPVNPTGSSPVLTQSQCWAGLKRKVQHAQEFVPIIASCEVLSSEKLDVGEKIVREVKFIDAGPKGTGEPLKEVCLQYEPCRVDFEQEDGSRISNVISKGPAGELMLTYVFEWRHPELEQGSEKAVEVEDRLWKTAKMAVDSSIKTIRNLVEKAEIQ
ncbi:hypothetical protein BX600DRAFT_514580 [Xylariales sp. PMI_506]|nr:hypothetical protein BX600DRAFT_514580 [Xylariales sp. PMI_506]